MQIQLKLWIAIFLFVFGGENDPGYAQTKDSLSDQYQKMADTLLEIASVYELTGRWDDAILLLEHGIEIMIQGDFRKGKAQMQALLGGIIWKRGHHQIANLYQNNGDREKALEYYSKTIDTVQELGYKAFVQPAQNKLQEME